MKEKLTVTKCDELIKHWLEWRNQQGQSSGYFSVNKAFRRLRKIHKITPVLESLFNKVSSLKTCNSFMTKAPIIQKPVR